MPWEQETEVHGSETKAITISIGTGSFIFDYVRIIDEAGVERYSFAKGEKVGLEYSVKNTGSFADTSTTKVVDADTGAELWKYLIDLGAGKSSGNVKKPVLLTMPDKDVHLSVSVTP